MRRCRLRIVRRGGWSWGARPAEWLHAAIAAIPELIAEELEALFPETLPDLVIAEPVQVRIGLRGAKRIRIASADAPDVRARLRPELKTQIAQALAGFVETRLPFQEEESLPEPRTHHQHVDLSSEPALRWLAEMARSGELAPLLRLLPEASLAQWAECLFEEFSIAQTINASVPADEWREWLDRFAEEFGPPPSTRRGRLQRLLFAAGKFAAHAGVTSWSAAIQHVLLAEFPVDVASRAPASELETAFQPTASKPSRQTAARTNVPAKRTEVAVPCALPFLLLNPLADAGYWQALDAALEIANLRDDDAPLFAASLAFKVLAPPKRGWRRDHTAPIAAAFAGLERVDDAALSELARRFAHAAPLLHAAILRAFVKAFRANDPLLLLSLDDGWLLAETDCAAPVAFAESLDGIIASLRQFPSPLVLTTAPQAHARLDDEAIAFADLAHPRDAKSRSLSHRFADLPARVADSWSAIAIERPSVPRANDPTLSLAASAALSTIAWKLWHTRESCDARLTLERFADFSATVRFDADAVRVRFPMGRRFFDLREHRLLDSIAAIPWLPGRTVIFTGG